MANELTASEVVEMWINSIVSEVSKREDVSEADKERAKKEYGDVEYADEKNKKYPLDEKHIHAAWSYINMPKNAAKYSPEELASIKNRIKRAAKKYGMEISEDKNKEKAEMDKEEEKKETPEEEKKESPEKEKEEKKEGIEAEYSAMKKDMADMITKMEKANTEKAELESKLQAAQTQLAEVQKTLKEHRMAELKSKFVASVMTEEEFTAKADTLYALSDDVIELMTRNREKKPAEGQRMMAEADGAETVTVKLFRTK